MSTKDKEAAESTFAPQSIEPKSKASRHAGPSSIGIAVVVGALFLVGGAAAGFAAGHAASSGDRDDGLGGLSSRMGGGDFPTGDMQGMQGRIPGGMMGGALGKVTSVSDTSITLTDDRSGGSVTFQIDSNTDVSNNGDTAKVSDIKTGDTVSVRGTSATDDTLADTIVINPASRQ